MNYVYSIIVGVGVAIAYADDTMPWPDEVAFQYLGGAMKVIKLETESRGNNYRRLCSFFLNSGFEHANSGPRMAKLPANERAPTIHEESHRIIPSHGSSILPMHD